MPKAEPARPILVFFDCSKKTVEVVGNNNDYSELIFGVRPLVVQRTLEEIAWVVRGVLDDQYYIDLIRTILEVELLKQGIDAVGKMGWTSQVRLVMLNSLRFDAKDEGAKKLLKKFFPKASFYLVDQWGNAERIWGRGQRRSPAPQASQPGELHPGMGNIRIEELELGVRSYHCLKRMGIEIISDLVAKTRPELEAIPNFGRRSVDEVEGALSQHGLSLRVTS